MHEILNFSSTPIPNTGVWILENGFSIEAGGLDLICNLSIINFIDFSQKSYSVAKEGYHCFLLA